MKSQEYQELFMIYQVNLLQLLSGSSQKNLVKSMTYKCVTIEWE